MLNSVFSIFVITAIVSDVTYGQSGTPATAGQFKYAVSLWLRGSYMCGGAILNERFILTAGHCIKDQPTIDLRVIVGVLEVTNSTKWHQVRSTYVPFDYEVVQTSSNPPKYQSTNDIGIIKLLEKLVLDATIQPIELSTLVDPLSYQPCELTFYREEESLSIKKVYLSLWWAPVLIASRSFCVISYSHVFTNQVCVFNSENYLKPIRGDSGSPVTCDRKLFGIVQSGIQNQYGPVIVTLVAPYVKFIEDVISGRTDRFLRFFYSSEPPSLYFA